MLALVAGVGAGSIALTGFGLDSSIEVLASAVAAWQLRRPTTARTRVALGVIGASYVVVAGRVGVESVRRLVAGRRAEASALGVAVTAAAGVAMTALGVAKRSVARRLRNEVLRAEASRWWADPAAAIAVALVAAREGVSELRSSGRRESGA